MILSLDIGTSSTRAILYDVETCQAIPGATHAIPHDAHATPDGGSTLDPEEIVHEAIACAQAVLPKANGQPILGVGISTFWHSFLGIDKNGTPKTPILLWSDTRSAPQVAKLREELDTVAYSQRTGCPLHTSYPPGRMRWLAENDPDAFAASERFVSAGEYLIGKLCGWDRVTCSVSMASGTGLLDQAKGAWDEETIRHIPGLSANRLSPISDEPVSGLVPAYRSALPSLADVPWFPALGDGACSNIGCGATVAGTIALMIGTSGALRVVVPAKPGEAPPTLPGGLWRYHIDSRRYIFGGALSNGGSVWAWAKRIFKLPAGTNDTFEEALAALKPDGHGLTVLPFLSGERAPLWRDDLRATIHGLSAATTPTEIVRAHLEAVSLRFAAIREALRPVAPDRATVIGTGGALIASPVWAQILVDSLGESIQVSSEEQASSRGAALWVREKLGKGTMETAPPVPITKTIEPIEANVAIYQKARERQEALLGQLVRGGF